MTGCDGRSLGCVVAIAVLVFKSALAQSGAAASPTPSELRAAYEVAFQQTLEKPADPQTLVTFAELAVQYGDIEGAISALERLLLLDADQPEVRLELGVLYFRLRSLEAARTYLESAIASPSATADVKERAQEFLRAAAEAKRGK
jgi:uncharacterized protein HemY